MLAVALCLVLVLLLVLDRLKFRHWSVRNVAHQPALPFVGHYLPVLLGRKATGQFYDHYYRKYKDLPYFGVYEYYRPVLVVNDLKLAEHILIKDFSSFANHPRWVIDESCYLSHATFNLRGNLWRATRYKLTPSFTSAKMQQALSRILQKAMPTFQEGEVEIQEKLDAVAADMIAAYFGATIDDKKAFVRAMYEQTHTSALRHVELQFLEHFPKLAAWTGMTLIHRSMNELMSKTVQRLINGWGVTSEIRTLLESIKEGGAMTMKAKDFDIDGRTDREHVFEPSDDLLFGQAAQFFFAGLDTTSNTMGFLAYEFATHPEAQETARSEVVKALAKHDGQWTYQLLQDLQYMQYCINESTRLHSVLPFVFREATRDYTFPGTNLQLKKGDKIVLPAISYQTDPRYYPDPMEFKPERWQTEDKTRKFTWLPFGEGPRQCLGMRFAFMEIKLVLAKLLMDFEISVSPKTQMPPGHNIFGFLGRFDRPVHVHLKEIPSGC